MSKENTYLAVPKDPKLSPSWIPIVIMFCIPATVPIAAIMLIRRLYLYFKRERLRALRRYAPLINSAHSSRLSLKGLASALGKSVSTVRIDLREMLANGYLSGPAYIDAATDELVLSTDDAGERVYTVFTSREAKPAQEAKPEPKPAPKPEPPKPEPPKPEGETVDIEQTLRRLKKLNDEIEHEGVSTRIDRIAELTANIMQRGISAGRDAEMRKFMSYYLPTTLKLLESYSLLEKQSYQGSNILAARADIERILDTVIKGFEQQLDRMFSTDVLDISSDISVLEQMFASDGLAGGVHLGETGPGESRPLGG